MNNCFALQKIKSLLSDGKVPQTDKLRLVMLYALRYESHSNNDVSGLVETLRKQGISDKHRAVCIVILWYTENSVVKTLIENYTTSIKNKV